MFDETELKRMTPDQRADLARALAALDARARAADRAGRRRRLVIGAALIGAVGLAIWIAVLATTLPRMYRAGGWRLTWVGFDIGLLLVLAATAWAAWRRRQILIMCLIVLATLLCCDAWFDTTLDWATRGFAASLVLALAVELPVAAAALVGARRLLRLTTGHIEHLEGVEGPVPPFWKVPLFWDSSIGYRHLWSPPKVSNAASQASPAGAERRPRRAITNREQR